MSDLSPAEVAEDFGVSREAIYRAIQDGELPAYKVRGRLRVEAAELAAFKARNTIQPRPKTPAYEPKPRQRHSVSDDYLRELRAVRRAGRRP